jgi:ADP-heptose:LPS heptosyltransferase
MKILVGFDNGIGNFIIFTQALRAIAEYFNSPVYLMLSSRWSGGVKNAVESLAKACPFVERVLEYPKDFKLEKWDYTFMSFHSNFLDPMFSTFHGGEFDWDRAESWAGGFLSESVYYHCEVAQKFGINSWPDQFCPYDEDSEFVTSLNPGYICISNSYLRTKQGELDRKTYPHWSEVIKTIHCLNDERDIVLIGGKDDQDWAGTLMEDHPYLIDYTGQTTILETAGVIKNADAILSTDTGCYHIADALGVPGVVIFGATLVSKNGPLNNSLVVVRSPLPCAPCQGTMFWEMCQSRDKCMKNIDPGLVIAALKKVIYI